MSYAVLLVLQFLVGLMVGSFLNVCVYRLPRDESVLFGRSYCPECRSTIPWYDNLPLVSYLMLGGHCRECEATISLEYPVGELLGGLVCLGCAIWWLGAPDPEWINYTVSSSFILVCLTASRIDLKESIIPNEINYLFILVGVILGFVTHYPLSRAEVIVNPGQFLVASVGLLVGGGFFLTLALISPLIYGKPALGMGDVKLMAGVGAWLGTKLVLFTIAVGSLIGAVIGTALMLYQGRSLRTEIPFGPFLCSGAVLGLIAGEPIINWYVNLI